MKARAFLLGFVAGALGGMLLIEFGIGLPVLAVGAFAVGCAVRPLPIGAAGTLIGWGTTWIALFANAARACAADRNCGDTPPSVVPWIAIGAAAVVAGCVLLVLADRRRVTP